MRSYIYGMALTQEKEQNGSKNKHKNFLPVIYVHIHESKQADEPIGVRGGGAGGAAAPPILREIIIFGQFLLKYSGNLWG